MLTSSQVDALLRRIRAERPDGRSAEALSALHEAFRRSVPSEDYDIHARVPISLGLSDLHDKIVRRHRGGFCYELNGLFAALLVALGFPVLMVSAFSLAEDGARGPDFDHLRLLVGTSEGRWIADVGNGAVWTVPVPARPGEYGDVRVHVDGDLWWTAQRGVDGHWARDWAWTPVPRSLSDFAGRCRFHESDPSSYFVSHRFAVLPAGTGRISLLNGVFSEIADGTRTDREVSRREEIALLADRFGIVIDQHWPEK